MMLDTQNICIEDYDYLLPDERIAKFPLQQRDNSQLLVYKAGNIEQHRFSDLPSQLPDDVMLIFNNTRVIQARMRFRKATGALIEIFCLEPLAPVDYALSLQSTVSCRWLCLIGNAKKWKEGSLQLLFEHEGREVTLAATRGAQHGDGYEVEFAWDDTSITFGELLETLGELPIPPYLNRATEESDKTTYQTVYSKIEGSVAAPTAGLHFTDRVIDRLHAQGVRTEEVTLHVGAGTFLPVKEDDVTLHTMHTEHFEFSLATLKALRESLGRIIPVGTTSVRTLESLVALGWRIISGGSPDTERVIDQWELYDIPAEVDGEKILSALIAWMEERGESRLKAATQIMIMPGYQYRLVSGMVTNFHQPKSTLLLLVSAFVGEEWRKIYDYALANDFRFLSYGDSSLLLR